MNTYYEWKRKDQDFQYEMTFYEDYVKNVSLKTIGKWARIDPKLAMDVAKLRDDRYKPQLAELPQVQLITINQNIVNVQQLQTVQRANIDVYEPEEVQKLRQAKFANKTGQGQLATTS